MKFTYYRQLDAMDCGPTCLKMVAKHYGKNINIDAVCNASGIGKEVQRNWKRCLDMSKLDQCLQDNFCAKTQVYDTGTYLPKPVQK